MAEQREEASNKDKHFNYVQYHLLYLIHKGLLSCCVQPAFYRLSFTFGIRHTVRCSPDNILYFIAVTLGPLHYHVSLRLLCARWVETAHHLKSVSLADPPHPATRGA